jgi:hypothetical protein
MSARTAKQQTGVGGQKITWDENRLKNKPQKGGHTRG